MFRSIDPKGRELLTELAKLDSTGNPI
jgi:hypothetical protein